MLRVAFSHIKQLISDYSRRPEQNFIIFQAYLGSFFIFLFGVYRVLQADWALAAVDLSMVMALLALAYFASRDLYFRVVTLCFIVVVVAGSWATIYYGGGGNIYWSFPVVLVMFYVLRIKEALWINAVSLIALAVLYYNSGHNYLAFIACYILVTLYAFQFAYLMKKDNERLAIEAQMDALTQVGNRRALDDAMLDAIAEFEEMGTRQSLILIDIDYFKRINDDFGHNVGDICLQRMAATIEEILPEGASLYRFGGEEFTVLTKDSVAQTQILAENIRQQVEQATLIRERPVTISSGVAGLLAGNDAREWLHSADVLLYLAKHQGRNQVCVQELRSDQELAELNLGGGI
jgi:diguanylate cyclase (GGDEF)-like protein